MHASSLLSASLVGVFFALTLACTPSEDGEDEINDTGDTDTTAATDETVGECMTPGVYGNCVDGGAAACQAEGSTVCPTDSLDNPSLGVCAKHCADACECWAAPATGNAEVACVPLVDGDSTKTCVLDCASGQTCPDGMECLDTLSICVWPSAG